MTSKLIAKLSVTLISIAVLCLGGWEPASQAAGAPSIRVNADQSATTSLISVASDGTQANSSCAEPAISANGRFVVFHSAADNLVEADANGELDVFVHDRESGQTRMISISSAGEQGNCTSRQAAISGDGRVAAFRSCATNLVNGDSNDAYDVFIHLLESGETRRVSISSAGEEANGHSEAPALSFDGRFVAFASQASNLVDGDSNNRGDIFVHDQQTGQTVRVSVASDGVEANSSSSYPSISADGRWIAFESYASNLADGDTNNLTDIFVHDRESGQTRRVSTGSAGEQGNDESLDAAISADGNFVSFHSLASNLVSGDSNAMLDVFIKDLQSGQTSLVSVSSGGEMGNSHSGTPSLSSNGRYIAFFSYATNLVPGDTNLDCDWDGDEQTDDNCPDIFVHDQVNGSTQRVSVSSEGAQSDGWSSGVAISADGNQVVFDSWAGNLVAGDANLFCDTDQDGFQDDNCQDVFLHAFKVMELYLPLTIKK